MKTVRLGILAALLLVFPPAAHAGVVLIPDVSNVSSDLTSEEVRNQSHRGAAFVVSLVPGAGTGTVTPIVQVWDEATETWRAYASFTALSGSGTFFLLLDARADATNAPADLEEVLQAPVPLSRLRLRLDKSDGSTWLLMRAAVHWIK